MIKPKDPDVLEAIDTDLDDEPAPKRRSARTRKAAGDDGDGDRTPEDAEAGNGSDAADSTEGSASEDPSPDIPHAADAAFDEPAPIHHDEPHPDHAQRGFASTALMALLGILFVASLTLWAAPKLAPHVPAGIGQYLAPGKADDEARLSALDKALADGKAQSEAAVAALTGQVAELSARVEAAEKAGADAATRAGADAMAAAKAAADAAASLTGRLTAVETEIAALRDEQQTVAKALSDAASSGGTVSPELSAAVASLTSRIDTLSATVKALPDAVAIDSRIAGLTSRIEEAESSAAAARSAQSETLGEVSSAIHQASLRSAVAALGSRMAGGSPYAEQLGEVTALTGKPAPEAVAAGAESGLATAADLAAAYPPAAQAAVNADVQSRAGDGMGSLVVGWLRAQVTGRPTTEQEGDSVGAITSRIGARLEEGAMAKALAEAETLPPHSQAAMGDWLGRLRAAVAARTALDSWLAEIGAAG